MSPPSRAGPPDTHPLPVSSPRSPRQWVLAPGPLAAPQGQENQAPVGILAGGRPPRGAQHVPALSGTATLRPPDTCREGPLLYSMLYFSRCHVASSHFLPFPGTAWVP